MSCLIPDSVFLGFDCNQRSNPGNMWVGIHTARNTRERNEAKRILSKEGQWMVLGHQEDGPLDFMIRLVVIIFRKFCYAMTSHANWC